jgi:hypothetical protein
MLRNNDFDSSERRARTAEDAMHAQFIEDLARQHIADLHAAADQRRRAHHGQAAPRPSLRTRLGWLLVRWGQRLAPTPRVAAGRPRPATMGP